MSSDAAERNLLVPTRDLLRISASSRGLSTAMSDLWSYRELFWVLATRDLQVRYRQTVLGLVWVLLQPLLQLTVFSVLLGRIARLPSNGVPYVLFVCCGLLPWTFLSATLTHAGGSVIGSAQLVTKVYFPRLVIPVAAIAVGLVDFVVASFLLVVLVVYFQIPIGWRIIGVLPAVALMLITSLGVGTLFAALTVTYRDFSHTISFVLQAWMYASPVVYSAELIPPSWRLLYFLNPVAGVAEGMRAAVLNRPFDCAALACSTIVGIALLLVGVGFFLKKERTFADVI